MVLNAVTILTCQLRRGGQCPSVRVSTTLLKNWGADAGSARKDIAAEWRPIVGQLGSPEGFPGFAAWEVVGRNSMCGALQAPCWGIRSAPRESAATAVRSGELRGCKFTSMFCSAHSAVQLSSSAAGLLATSFPSNPPARPEILRREAASGANFPAVACPFCAPKHSHSRHPSPAAPNEHPTAPPESPD